MGNLHRFQLVTIGTLLVFVTFSTPTEERGGNAPADGGFGDSARVPDEVRLENLGPPLSFEPNQGQADPTVKFLSRGKGYELFLTAGEALLALSPPAARPPGAEEEPSTKGLSEDSVRSEGRVVRMELVGAHPSPVISPVEELPGRSHYYLGNDPEKWCTDVPHYGKVLYRNVYDGIDLVYYGNEGQLEHDFVVAPRADPGQIALLFTGVDSLDIAPNGDLVLGLGEEELRFQRPFLYQEKGSHREPVEGKYVLKDVGLAGFQVSSYDTGRELVIDPVLVYSTFLGGRERDDALGVAVDSGGSAYVYGQTNSSNFWILNALQPVHGGGSFPAWDMFVTKLDPAGALVYSTYVGGGGLEFPSDLEVDLDGNAYLTGAVGCSSFAIAITNLVGPGGGSDAILLKLSPTGQLLYSTCMGGSADDSPQGIGLDSANNVYVLGRTLSTDFPTTNAGQSTLAGSRDAFVAKLDAAGFPVYSTYLGGDSNDVALEIAVDASGNAVVTGHTVSLNFPTTPGALDADCGTDGQCNPRSAFPSVPPQRTQDGFVTKLDPNGGLVFSTYLGGSDSDIAWGVATDSNGNAYVSGWTGSSDFPTLNAVQSGFGGGTASDSPVLDAFVTKLNPTGGLIFSTYLGGSRMDVARDGIAADADGNVYVTGRTISLDFPTTANAVQPAYGGPNTLGDLIAEGTCQFNQSQGCFLAFSGDIFVTKLDTDGDFVYSTYLGGSLGEPSINFNATGNIAIDKAGSAYVTGYTASADFPTVNAPPGIGGAGGFFVTKLAPSGAFSYSTFLGAALGVTFSSEIAVDPVGNAVVTGSFNFGASFLPTVNAIQSAPRQSLESFVAKIGADNQIPVARCQDVAVSADPGVCTADVSVDDGSFDPDGDPIALDVSPAGPYALGDTVVTLTVTDDSNVSDSCTARVTVLDTVPPAIDCPADIVVVADDSCQAALPDFATGASVSEACVLASITQAPAPGELVGLGTTLVSVTATDASGNNNVCTARFTLADATAPVVSMTSGSPNPVAVGTPFEISAHITDLCSNIVSAEYSIDDGVSFQPMNPIVTPASSVIASVTVAAGVPEPTLLSICVRGTDAEGNTSDAECAFLPVYDPEGGFVTGGGWIDSPAPACPEFCGGAAGKANFGFVSKYKKGQNTPTGQTEFQFKAGDLNLHSDTYEWLVVAGHKAVYKGTGTINGAGNYGFLLSAVDADLTPSTEDDLFRIKIWDKNDYDEIVYDNEMGEAEDEAPTTAVGGGNIKIHAAN